MNSYENFIIEGIGNEVLVFLTGLVTVSLFTYFIYQRYMNSTFSSHNLHIRNEEPQLSQMSNSLIDGTDSNMNRPRHYGGSDQLCPVCLNEPRFSVETNCGHVFCAQCIITYWRHGNWIGAIRCPVCRQMVTVLITCFRESTDVDPTERTQFQTSVNEYNRRFSGEPRPWLDYIWDLPTLLRHAGTEFFSFGGIMYMFRIRILLCFVAALTYLISPLDMIPEAVFGILGLLDDLFILFLVALYVTVIYRRFLASQWQNQ